MCFTIYFYSSCFYPSISKYIMKQAKNENIPRWFIDLLYLVSFSLDNDIVIEIDSFLLPWCRMWSLSSLSEGKCLRQCEHWYVWLVLSFCRVRWSTSFVLLEKRDPHCGHATTFSCVWLRRCSRSLYLDLNDCALQSEEKNNHMIRSWGLMCGNRI